MATIPSISETASTRPGERELEAVVSYLRERGTTATDSEPVR